MLPVHKLSCRIERKAQMRKKERIIAFIPHFRIFSKTGIKSPKTFLNAKCKQDLRDWKSFTSYQIKGFMCMCVCVSISALEAGLRDRPFASQWGCAVPSPLQSTIRWFFCREAAQWGCRHLVTMQRCCPAHALFCFGGDVGRTLGAFDASCASSHFSICHLVSHVTWAIWSAAFYHSSSSCSPIGQWKPWEGPPGSFLTWSIPWFTLLVLSCVLVLL